MEDGSCVVMKADQGLGIEGRCAARRHGFAAIATVSALNLATRCNDKCNDFPKAALNNTLMDNVLMAVGHEMNRKVARARCSNDSFGIQSMPEPDRFAVTSGPWRDFARS
jgi:hypothetical protein